MTKRILVTGGAGFIGSHLTDELIKRTHEVVVIDNEITGNREFVNSKATYIKGDVREEAHLKTIFADKLDAVCHIAGQASIRLSFMNPADDLNVNTLGTINVLKQCVEHKVPRLLFASSMTLYGTPDQVPTPETAPINPIAYYGVTKYAAERYVHLTAERKDLDFDFNVTSFRMFNVYGVRQSLTNAYQGVLAIFLGRALRGEPITIHSDGEQSRDFVHVSDVVRAWADSLDAEKTYGQVINIGSGNPTSINKLCDMVLASVDKTRDTYDVSYGEAQPGDVRVSAADITRAKTLLNWQPKMDFETGMRETVAWAKSQIETTE